MRLGIDFGTTRIVVAAVDRGNYPIVTFEDAEGTSREWYPPLIAIREGAVIYGWDAWNAQCEQGWHVIRSIKRTLEESLTQTMLVVEDAGFEMLLHAVLEVM